MMHKGFGTKRPWMVRGMYRRNGWSSPVERRYSTADLAREGMKAMEADPRFSAVEVRYKPVR